MDRGITSTSGFFSGRLEMTMESGRQLLEPGDCLFMGLKRPTSFTIPTRNRRITPSSSAATRSDHARRRYTRAHRRRNPGRLPALAEILSDCVEGGASVGFMHPFSPHAAVQFWEGVAAAVGRGETVLLAAEVDGRMAGTVQLGVGTMPNQPHRADVRKLLVHRDGPRPRRRVA